MCQALGIQKWIIYICIYTHIKIFLCLRTFMNFPFPSLYIVSSHPNISPFLRFSSLAVPGPGMPSFLTFWVCSKSTQVSYPGLQCLFSESSFSSEVATFVKEIQMSSHLLASDGSGTKCHPLTFPRRTTFLFYILQGASCCIHTAWPFTRHLCPPLSLNGRIDGPWKVGFHLSLWIGLVSP